MSPVPGQVLVSSSSTSSLPSAGGGGGGDRGQPSVAAVMVAAGVENAHDVARALHAEEFDVETLRISSFDDVEEFGIVDEATMQRIHECLPPELPPPTPTPPPTYRQALMMNSSVHRVSVTRLYAPRPFTAASPTASLQCREGRST